MSIKVGIEAVIEGSASIDFITEDYSKNILIETGKVYMVDAILLIEPILMAKLEIISEVETPYDIMPGAATVMDINFLGLFI